MGSETTPSGDVLPDAGSIECARQDGETAYSELLARHLATVRAFLAMRLPIRHGVDEFSHETFGPLLVKSFTQQTLRR
jgi:hypothetical protein